MGDGDGHANRLAYDGFAWLSNVATSVLIVFVNKVLMDKKKGYAFTFATTLCALHFLTAAACVRLAQAAGWTQRAHLPWRVTLSFAVVADVSIASLNLSLLVNSVGFYQIAKLLIIPFVAMVELLWMKRRFTPAVVASILVVVAGVAIVTVTDMSVQPLGLLVAAVSVVSSGMQQILCGSIQRSHKLASHQLLANTAPVQGAMLLVVGPLVDRAVSGSWVGRYALTPGGLAVLLLSCGVSVGVNVSQFMCLGRFSAVTFQVLGHTKTVLVLLVSWAVLREPMSARKAAGMALAVAGMVAYGYSSSGGSSSSGEKADKSSSCGSADRESLPLVGRVPHGGKASDDLPTVLVAGGGPVLGAGKRISAVSSSGGLTHITVVAR